MAGFIFEEGTQAQASALADGDTLVFSTLAPTDITVTLNEASGLQVATVTLSGGGQTLTFAADALADANTLFVATGGQIIIGSDDPDALISTDDNGNSVIAFAGDDKITVGGDGDHLIHGDDGDDSISITGGAGNFVIFGDDGDDAVTNTGSTGALYISGGLGGDELAGGSGNDHIYGNVVAPSGTVDDGADFITAGAGNDYVNGNAGEDTIDGGAGNDRILGGAGDDSIVGGTGLGNDSINGNKGEDFIDGGAGNDSLRGGADDDEVSGGIGNDIVQGDLGDDVISGGTGADVLSGGEGEDVFVFAAGDAAEITLGTSKYYDVITDFSVEDDLIDLGSAPSDVLHVVSGTVTNTFAAAKAAAQALITAGDDSDIAAVTVGTDTYLFYDSDTLTTPGVIDSYIKLIGINAADITADSFVAVA